MASKLDDRLLSWVSTHGIVGILHIEGSRLLSSVQKLLKPPPGMDVDFRYPIGASALAPTDGVSWRIFANPISLFVGGITAVLLELAHPAVRTGVWEHSSFRRDPFTRLHRTGYAAMVTVYAPREAAQAMIARVVRMHSRVQGHTPEGMPYAANDAVLLTWVQATAIFGFTQAFHHYVRPLSAADKDAAFVEGQTSALLYGALDLPHCWTDWEELLATTAPQLRAHEIVQEFLQIMAHTSIFPHPLRWIQKLLIKAAVELIPKPVSRLLQLDGYAMHSAERLLVCSLALTANLIQLPQLPPVQARQRVREMHH